MTDSVQQVWVIPGDPNDLAPLPALFKHNGEDRQIALYDRRKKEFGSLEPSLDPVFRTFEICRAVMIDLRTEALEGCRARSLHHARVIEHIRTIPTATFPSDALQHNAQQQQEEAVQEEAKAEEVKPAKAELKRPSRRG